jgi:hypothetical protein
MEYGVGRQPGKRGEGCRLHCNSLQEAVVIAGSVRELLDSEESTIASVVSVILCSAHTCYGREMCGRSGRIIIMQATGSTSVALSAYARQSLLDYL